MRPAVLAAVTLFATVAGLLPALAQPAPARASEPASEIAEAIAAVEARFDSALAARDRAALEPLLTPSFAWIHASDGRVETREVWLAEAARGMALSRQRESRSVFEPTLALHGDHTAIRTTRVRLRDADGARETWMRQTTVFVREGNAWRLAAGQGTRMYEGPWSDPALYARYAGTYAIAPGRELVLAWDGDTLLAMLPSGARTQIFLASPTEEAVVSTALARLRFSLAPDGRPTAAELHRAERILWRAERASP